MTEYMIDDGLGRVVYDDHPVLLLFGNDEAGLDRARAAAERAHCRIEGLCGIDEAEARLDRQVSARAALVVADTPSPALDRLVARLGLEGRSGRLRPIILAPQGMIDTVAGADPGQDVDYLIDPTEAELAIAVALATATAHSRLHDVTR